MLIRSLTPQLDRPAVAALYGEAADYWLLADRRPPDAAKAAAFFTDAPPGVDPATSQHLGLYPMGGGRLGGVAVLSFGFPAAGDAYFDLLLLAPAFRGQGHGAAARQAVEDRARQGGARSLYLAVLAANPRGRSFWEREGFRATGASGIDRDTGHLLYRLGKAL
ncbi:MAG: GNAT family N-acetyltransferase [Rhodobacteraceae bacterium]|jgi:GNAT superfamily N-acetyltransferase|nr:GNAT family N-acetyltransferase [Paracoccaceae bacterium]